MSLVYNEKFDGGTNGTTITTSNTSASAITGTAAAGTFTTADSILGSMCADANCTAQIWVWQKTFTATGTQYVEFFFKPVTMPSANNYIAQALSSATIRAQLGVTTGNVFRLRNATTVVTTGTLTITTGQWYRLRWKLDNAGTNQTLEIYTGANLHGSTPDETLSGTYNSGTFDSMNIGNVNSDTVHYRFDEIAADSAAFPTDPVQSSGSTPISVTFTPTASGKKAGKGTAPATVVFSFTEAGTHFEVGGDTAYAGSTIVAELNRLANASHYPTARTSWLEEAGAANKWAGTSGLSTVGALNVKAGNTVGRYKDLQGVCNQLAGTSGLGAPEALRRVVS